MKVYDCFIFFNELDLLELRLNELAPVVDYFVIVEATRNFRKKEKPLFFQQNKERFSKFNDKIIYVVVDNYPTFFTKFKRVTPWHYENNQREHAWKGLKNANPEDQILFSDLDEIPSADSLSAALSDPAKYKVFEQLQSIYYINNVCTHINDFDGKAIAQRNEEGFGRWRGPVLTKKKNIKSFKRLRMTRDYESTDISVIKNAGWHLSYMGGVEAVINKMKSYAHAEYSGEDYTNPEVIKKAISSGADPLKSGEKYELFPITDKRIPYLNALKNNPEKWKHMLGAVK